MRKIIKKEGKIWENKPCGHYHYYFVVIIWDYFWWLIIDLNDEPTTDDWDIHFSQVTKLQTNYVHIYTNYIENGYTSSHYTHTHTHTHTHRVISNNKYLIWCS